MVLNSNIFISNISTDNLNAKLELYKIINDINEDVIKEDFKKQYSVANRLSSKLDGVYIFSTVQNGFIGYSKKNEHNNIITIDNFNLQFIKCIQFSELSNYDKLNFIRNASYKKLSRNFISFNTNNFYFKRPIRNDEYIEFEGFNISYKTAYKNKIAMSLDISNKFLNTKSLMEEIKDESRYIEVKNQLNKYGKITLYDELLEKMITFDRISDKKPKDCYIKDVNIIDYIKSKHPNIKEISPDQPILVSNNYEYLSQFLHSSYDYSKLKNKKLLKPYERYNKINDVIEKYSINKININDYNIYFREIELNQSNTVILQKPDLSFNKGIDNKSHILDHLKSGFFKENRVEEVDIYSELPDSDTKKLYDKFRNFSYDNYHFILPDTYLSLENEKKALHNQLLKMNKPENVGIIISDNENVYREFIKANTNKFAFKGLQIKNAKQMLVYTGRSKIDNFLLSLYARAENKPWLLKDLNYDEYVFIDVGSGVAKYMAYTLINDHKSDMEIKSGNPQKGEALNEYNLSEIIDSFIMKDKKSIIYVRDGSISKSELQVIKDNYIDNFDNFIIIEYQKRVNYRLFDSNNGMIKKPKNGTCIKLNDENYIIVTTGYDEYKNLQGTPATKLITIKNLKGNYNVNKILNDIFAMCFLNWVSPRNNFADPAPIHYMDKLLNDKGNNINRSFIPY